MIELGLADVRDNSDDGERRIKVDPVFVRAPLVDGDRRTCAEVVPSTRRVTVRVKSGSNPFSIMRARASAVTVSDGDVVEESAPVEARRTFNVRPDRLDRTARVDSARSCRAAPPGLRLERSDPTFGCVPFGSSAGDEEATSLCGGTTMGATGKSSSATERRTRAGRGGVAAR